MKPLFLATACLLGLACASVPAPSPIAVDAIRPGAKERISPDDLTLLVDASGTIDERTQFPQEKALLGSIVKALPEGRYSAGTVVFGGHARDTLPNAKFDRAALARHASAAPHLSEGTPIADVLNELQARDAKPARPAVVLLSDGMPTDAGGNHPDGPRALEAAREFAQAHGGKACFHAVQVGDDPAGAAWLQELSSVTRCGTFHTADGLRDAGAIQAFARSVMLGAAPVPPPAPKPVAKKRSDADRDGVADAEDRCPGTPGGAGVDFRGCWVIPGLTFASGSAEIDSEGRNQLDKLVLPVLRANKLLRIRIDGHTDSSGSAAFNQKLSERRANAVKAHLTGKGIDSERLSARGFGAQKPAVPNDSKTNMRTNRRTELTVLP